MSHETNVNNAESCTILRWVCINQNINNRCFARSNINVPCKPIFMGECFFNCILFWRGFRVGVYIFFPAVYICSRDQVLFNVWPRAYCILLLLPERAFLYLHLISPFFQINANCYDLEFLRNSFDVQANEEFLCLFGFTFSVIRLESALFFSPVFFFLFIWFLHFLCFYFRFVLFVRDAVKVVKLERVGWK